MIHLAGYVMTAVQLIGLGFVREDLVRELCYKATRQLIQEGVQRWDRLE